MQPQLNRAPLCLQITIAAGKRRYAGMHQISPGLYPP